MLKNLQDPPHFEGIAFLSIYLEKVSGIRKGEGLLANTVR